jgi:hypothetical protein
LIAGQEESQTDVQLSGEYHAARCKDQPDCNQRGTVAELGIFPQPARTTETSGKIVLRVFPAND